MTQWGIDTLFNPGKRHMDEEKRRLQSTREEVGDSSGGRRIDLDSGKVRLPGRPGNGPKPEEPAAEAESAAESSRSDDAVGPSAGSAPAEAAEDAQQPEDAHSSP